ncbi:lytic polysaccharide monooxygenase [Xylariomycetidae sp. FL0641]|nr:lytic polysaccharide monooxygenase [Xylariomycetidae sp. FL0641]
MVSFTLATAAALLSAPLVSSHYILNILMHNGKQIGGEYTYVRKNSNTYMPSFFEIIDTDELRCNKGAKPSASIKTYDVKAGDKVGLKLFNNEFIEHPGPGFFYMSKAPGNVSEYDGSGDWFKVWESGPTGNAHSTGGWPTYGKTSMEFTLPKTLEDGEYLLRGEHIGIHENHVGKPQLYMECAHIRITGGSGTGTPSPMVKIPGIYSKTDPGLTFNFWGSGGTYEMPGPAVWNE